MNTLQKIAANTLVQIAGKAIGTLIGVVTIAIVTRALGPSGFGQFATIIAFLQVFGTLTDLGLNVMCVQLLAERERERERILGNLLTLRFLSAIFFLGGAVLLSLLFPYPAIVKAGIALTSLSFLAIVLHQIFVGFFQDRLRTDLSTIAEITGRLALLVITLIAVWMGKGLLGVLLAVVVSNILQLFIGFGFARAKIHICPRIDFVFWREVLARSWPIGLSVALTLLYLRMDTVVLSLYRSEAEVGWYGAAYRVIEVFTQIPFLFMGVVLPVLTRFWKKKERLEFYSLIQKAFDALSFLGIPLFAGSLFLAVPVMKLVAGSEFAPSGAYLKVLILALLFVFMSALFSYTIVAINAQRRMVFGYGLSAVLTLIGYFVFIPIYGAWAAAWLTVFSEGLVAGYAFLIVMRRSGFRVKFGRFGKALLASAGMALVLFALHGFGLLIPLCLGAATYVIILYGLGGFSKRFVFELMSVNK